MSRARSCARLLGAILVPVLLFATPVLAQEDDPAGPPPPLDTSKPIHKEATRHAAWFSKTPWGRILIVLVGGLAALRAYGSWKKRVLGDALAGRGGARERKLAEHRLRELLAYKRFEEAAELALIMGRAGWSDVPNDRTRELEAAELYLKGGRNVLAAEILANKGRHLRAGEAYERAQKWDKAAELFERAGEPQRAEKCWLELKDRPACARLWARAGDHRRAAAYFAEISPREAGEHLEKAGDTTAAAAMYESAFLQLVSNAAIAANLAQEPEAGQLFTRICKLYPSVVERADRERLAPLMLKHGIPSAIAHAFRKAGDEDLALKAESAATAKA